MLLFISLFTISLSLILFYNNWKVNRNSAFLSLFLISMSLYGIAHHFVMYGKSPFWLAIFYNHFTPLMVLVGPLLLFYVRGTLNDTSRLNKTDALHFIPAVVHFVGILPYTFQPFNEKLKIATTIINDIDDIIFINTNYFYSTSVNFVVRPVFLLLYVLYCMYLIWKRFSTKKFYKNTSKQQLLIRFRWLIILVISLFFIVVEFLIITYNSLLIKPSVGLINSYPMYILSGIAYCLMSFSLLLFPNILYGIPIRTDKIKKIKNKKNSISQNQTETIALEEDSFFDLAENIKAYLDKEKPFLNTNFTISDIALDMHMPQNHVSYCINTIMQTKFATLKTDLRIDYALELFSSDLTESFTIEWVSQQSGFKTRASFYSAFKERTGVTPTDYIAARNT